MIAFHQQPWPPPQRRADDVDELLELVRALERQRAEYNRRARRSRRLAGLLLAIAVGFYVLGIALALWPFIRGPP